MDLFVWRPLSDAPDIDALSASSEDQHVAVSDDDSASLASSPPLTERSASPSSSSRASSPPLTERSAGTSSSRASSPPLTERSATPSSARPSSSSLPSSAPSATSDESYRPHYRERDRVAQPQFRTLAQTAGYSTAHHHRVDRLLRLQHKYRLHDMGFCAMRTRGLIEQQPNAYGPEAAGRGAAADRITPADTAAIPSIRVWREWRTEFSAPCAPTSYNPLKEVAVRGAQAGATGVRSKREKITVYQSISAYLNMPETLLNLLFTHVPHGRLTPMALTADGIADVARDMPSRGKIYGMFLKAITLLKPQSPKWLLPVLHVMGNDNSNTLSPVFERMDFPRMVRQLQEMTYGAPPRTSLIFCFVADYPGCTAILHMLSPARQYPVTPGRLPAWRAYICHHCGISPADMYHVLRGRTYARRHYQDADRWTPDFGVSRIGVYVRLVFYDVVHHICVAAQSLLADIAIFYQKLSDRLHPVAAFAHSLFPAAVWDIFLVTPQGRSKDRRSRKPFYKNDPAVLWSWLTDSREQQIWFEVLAAHEVPLDVPVDPPMTPARTWSLFLHACDGIMRGDIRAIRTNWMFVEDAWRVMNGFAAPVPADVICVDPAAASSFYPPIVAYGPASHMGFCSIWRFIDWLDAVLPAWRRSGMTIPKITATIALEHGMKDLQSDYNAFAIASVPKRNRALALLTRSIERFTLDTINTNRTTEEGEAVTAAPSGAASGAAASQGAGASSGARPDHVNRAYADIPLSTPIPLHVLPEWARVPARYTDPEP